MASLFCQASSRSGLEGRGTALMIDKQLVMVTCRGSKRQGCHGVSASSEALFFSRLLIAKYVCSLVG